jgi:hypothetical protein
MTSAALDAGRTSLAILAVAASSGAPSTFVVPGPELIVVLGVTVPALSGLLGVLGVLLGQWLAPHSSHALGMRRRSALVLALVLLELGIVIATGQRPLVVMAWGIGLGFSGLSVVRALGDEALSGVRKIAEAFISAIATRIGGAASKETDK